MTNSLLSAEKVHGGYGRIGVLRGVDIAVNPGEVVALFGPNGAGKTTTLLTLAGLLPTTSGSIAWKGSTKSTAAHKRARQGLMLVPERSVFRQMTVESNLRLGKGDPEAAVEHFPELKPLMRRRAGLLSGGEQQMLTVGRALSTQPSLLLIDELSLGLAPVIVNRLLEAVRAAADSGVGVLLVEQQVERAMTIIDRGYVMVRGEVALEGTREVLHQNRHLVQSSYLA
ncbi:ABC transporter ATP-binding protein [Aeromicrobium panaciterrae]|uniref:ABC transporter ATP-binding protein n=1 Tax=Aeromicrobium panaciterrae TaxID=363861 RepID=UPI0031D09743